MNHFKHAVGDSAGADAASPRLHEPQKRRGVHRAFIYTTWRRAWLWLRIVYRVGSADARLGPALSWRVASLMWP